MYKIFDVLGYINLHKHNVCIRQVHYKLTFFKSSNAKSNACITRRRVKVPPLGEKNKTAK